MIVKQLSELLKMDVYAILLCAWNKYGEILKYSDSKKYPHEETFVVPLAEHTVISEHEPSLQLTLNKMPLGEIELDVRLALHLKGVLLNIKEGRIMAVTLGSCKGEGSVKYDDICLFERTSETFKLPGFVELEKGIPLHETSANIHYLVDTLAKA
jgi:hypothetical protein